MAGSQRVQSERKLEIVGQAKCTNSMPHTVQTLQRINGEPINKTIGPARCERYMGKRGGVARCGITGIGAWF
jgi:hypothetical protein